MGRELTGVDYPIWNLEPHEGQDEGSKLTELRGGGTLYFLGFENLILLVVLYSPFFMFPRTT